MANTVVFNADTTNYVQGIKSAEKQTIQSFGIMEKASSGIDNSFAKLGNQIKGLVGAYLGIYGIKKVIGFFNECAQAAGEQEKSIIKLNQVLLTSGIYTPQVSKHFQDLATNLQKVTIYGDEVTLSAIGMIQQFARLSQDQLTKIVPLIQDMASALGMDLNTAAMLVGKTLGSETNALSRYGIVLNDTKDKGQKLNELMIKLQNRFGGQAQEEAKGYAGQMAILNNEWSDMKEKVGIELIPVIREFIPVLKELAPIVETIAKSFVKLLKKILDVRDIQKEISDDMKSRFSVDLMDINNKIRELCKSYGFFVDENNKVYDALQREVPINNLPDELRHKFKVLLEESKIVQEQLGKFEIPKTKPVKIVEEEKPEKENRKKQVESLWAEEVTAIAKQRLDDWLKYKSEVMTIDTEMMLQKDQEEMIMAQIKYAYEINLLNEYLEKHTESVQYLKKIYKDRDIAMMLSTEIAFNTMSKFMELYIGKSMKANEALIKSTEYGARMMLSSVLDMIKEWAMKKAVLYGLEFLATGAPNMLAASIGMSALAGVAAGASAVNREVASRHAQETQPMNVNVVNRESGIGGGIGTETTTISRPAQAINITPTLIINAGAIDRETANKFFNEDFIPWFQRWTENI